MNPRVRGGDCAWPRVRNRPGRREVQQHRIVGARPAQHQAKVLAAGTDGAEFGDAAAPRLTAGIGDRCGGCRTEEERPESDERRRRDRCDRAAKVQAGRDAAGSGPLPVAASGKTGPEGRPEDHGHESDDAVEAASDDEGEDTVGAHGQPVDSRPVGPEAG